MRLGVDSLSVWFHCCVGVERIRRLGVIDVLSGLWSYKEDLICCVGVDL